MKILAQILAQILDKILAKISKQSKDLDGDQVTYSYKWEVNGIKVKDLKGDKLSFDIKKGHNIKVWAVPSDGKSEGLICAAEVNIANARPIVPKPVISLSNDGLKIQMQQDFLGKVIDPDNDEILFSYHWYIDDSLSEEDDNPWLDTKKLKIGQKVQLQVKVSDGETEVEVVSDIIGYQGNDKKLSLNE